MEARGYKSSSADLSRGGTCLPFCLPEKMATLVALASSAARARLSSSNRDRISSSLK